MSAVPFRARTSWIVAGLCALAAILAFANTLGHGLVYDDAQIVETPRMQSLGAWREVLTRPFRDTPQHDVELYRPVTCLSFALNGSVNAALGLERVDPRGFHALSVLAHAVASALVGILALRLALPRAAALAAGLVFALHPIHVEAVANVAQRAESLSVVFGVAFVLLHRARSAWSGAALLFAVGSKESALGFVAVALAWDLLEPERRRRVVAWIGPAIAVAVFLVARAHALADQVPRPLILENPAADAPALERIATALRVQALYLRLLVWPVGLSSDYSYDQIPLVRTFLDGRVLTAIGVIAAVAFAAWRWRGTRPRIAIAVVAYAGLFAVTSNLLFPIGTIAGERLVYAPSIGFALLCGELLAFAAERGRGRIAASALVVLLAVGAILTVRRNRTWADEPTLFRAQAADAPYSARAHQNLATALIQHGDSAGAVPELERSLEIAPENSQAWYLLGVALYNLRAEPQRVVGAFQQALRIGPLHHDARLKLGLVWIRLRRLDEARAVAAELERLAPDEPRLAELRAAIAAAR